VGNAAETWICWQHAPPAWQSACDDLRNFLGAGGLHCLYAQVLNLSATSFAIQKTTAGVATGLILLEDEVAPGLIVTAATSYRLSHRGICPALTSGISNDVELLEG
jgi:hypothetical protein